MPCPFGFNNAEEVDGNNASDDEAVANADTSESKCPFSAFSAGTSNMQNHDANVIDDEAPQQKAGKGGGFDIEKDPVSWFFQHQVRSEEEFQKKKVVLREAAKKQLDSIYDKKGKKLQWTSDSGSEWSISTNELSELDSDVDSISSLVSCANSWIGEYSYSMPATTTLKFFTAAAAVAIGTGLYHSYQAYQAAAQYWGILAQEWLSVCSIVLGMTGILWLAVGVVAWRNMNRRWLLSYMIGLHVLEACGIVLTVSAMAFPTEVRKKVRTTACGKTSKTEQNSHLSQLCQMLPSINRSLQDANTCIVWAGAAVSLSALLILLACSWFEIELSYIEKRSTKHKRRRRRRKHQIPWDKIKIIGPVSNCGGVTSNRPQKASKNNNAAVVNEQTHRQQPSELKSVQRTAAGKKVLGTGVEQTECADASSPTDTSKIKAA